MRSAPGALEVANHGKLPHPAPVFFVFPYLESPTNKRTKQTCIFVQGTEFPRVNALSLGGFEGIGKGIHRFPRRPTCRYKPPAAANPSGR